jgi:hypothetical protein
LVVPSNPGQAAPFPGRLLLPFCAGVSLACYVGPPGAPHGSQYVQSPNLEKGRW